MNSSNADGLASFYANMSQNQLFSGGEEDAPLQAERGKHSRPSQK